MVSFIVDENNKKTHAVIPIKEWNEIVDGIHDKGVKAIIDGTIGMINGDNKTIIPALISSLHILNMFESPTFLNALKEMYWYVSSASPSEIGLMYLLRTDEFATYIHSQLDEENIKRIHEDFYITDLQGTLLSLKKAKRLQSMILNNTAMDGILKEFRISFIIGVKNNQKRVRRGADIKRFFIFDALEYFPKAFPDLVLDIDVYKNDLATHLYPDNTKESAMAQLNKAYREAKDRIYSHKWVEYLGK